MSDIRTAAERLTMDLDALAHRDSEDGNGFDPEGGCRFCAHGGEPVLGQVRACPDCICEAGQRRAAAIQNGVTIS